MTPTQDTLFGQAPRRVGTPSQHWVFHPEQVDLFIDAINGRRNAYATAGWWDFAEGSVCDKVLYDLDSTAKAEPHETGGWSIFDGTESEEPPDDEVVQMMRNDPDLADRILGDVCEDARALADRSDDENVPIVGVFSGFGIHIHQLYGPTLNPSVAMSTTALRYVDRTSIETADHSIFGQTERICRIPNCERVADSVKAGGNIVDGRGCGIYTVPLTAAELASVDPQWLLDVSHSPREISVPDAEARPEMRVWNDYETGHEETADIPPRPLNPNDESETADDDVRWLVENLISMPCIRQRLLDDPNPDHDVRVYATVLLLNVGLNPQQVVDLYSMINWVDWDRSVTAKQVQSIYKHGYSDRSCKALRQKGLCVKSEEPETCRAFGWNGGKCEWKQ